MPDDPMFPPRRDDILVDGKGKPSLRFMRYLEDLGLNLNRISDQMEEMGNSQFVNAAVKGLSGEVASLQHSVASTMSQISALVAQVSECKSDLCDLWNLVSANSSSIGYLISLPSIIQDVGILYEDGDTVLFETGDKALFEAGA